jgi:hypothetical protein
MSRKINIIYLISFCFFYSCISNTTQNSRNGIILYKFSDSSTFSEEVIFDDNGLISSITKKDQTGTTIRENTFYNLEDHTFNVITKRNSVELSNLFFDFKSRKGWNKGLENEKHNLDKNENEIVFIQTSIPIDSEQPFGTRCLYYNINTEKIGIFLKINSKFKSYYNKIKNEILIGKDRGSIECIIYDKNSIINGKDKFEKYY